MTVDAPEFDENLDGAAAIAINGICHAVVSAPDGREMHNKTECDYAAVDPRDVRSRAEFEDDGAPMCLKCWPADVVDGTDTNKST